jgi:ADP-ribose pyrophosphatase YjhB (NUDIX family)
MTSPVPRLAGRALLVDTDGRVLLLHEQLEPDETHWLTPGGGVEDGERPSQAAAREVFEETGIEIELAPDAEPVLVQRDVWSLPAPAEVTYDQENHFFLALVPAGLRVRPHALTALEQQTQLGSRWWTAAELRNTDQTVYPGDLADVLDRVLGASAPGA